MFLETLTIERVRTFEHLELSFETESDLPRKRTIVVGDNGTGKTVVLQCIALLLAGSDNLPHLLGDPDDWIRVGHDDCRIAATLTTKSGRRREIALVLERGQRLKDILAANAENLERLDAALEHTPRSYLTLGYGNSRCVSQTLGGAASQRGGGDRTLRSECVATLFDPEAPLFSVRAWAREVHYQGGDRGLAQVMEALNSLLPGVEFEAIDRATGDLVFATPDGSLPLRTLNGGFQTMAAWCGDLLYRVTRVFQNYKNPLHARGLLLLDEVELHLHPRWQRQLVQFLDEQLPNVQIVGTTYSPLLAQQLEEGELFFLSRPAAGAAAVLTPYVGSPQRLLTHQMLLNPAFGLETMDSLRIERLRDEYRALASLPALLPPQATRLAELEAELQDQPDWSRDTDLERENRDLMRQIRDALAAPSP